MKCAAQCGKSLREAGPPSLLARPCTAGAARRAILRPVGGRAARLAVCAAYRLQAPNNPAFQYGNLDDALGYSSGSRDRSNVMTMDGTVNKAALMLGICALAATYTWTQVFAATSAAGVMAVLGASRAAGVVGIIAAIASMFKPQWSPATAPLYALCQGVALAGMSAFLELRYAGIAMNAIILTVATAASCMVALKARWVNVNDRFVDTVRTVMGGYFLSMLAVWLLSMVGVKLPGMFTSGPIAIGIGLVSAGLAAANLLIDFQFLSDAADQRLPKWMEWYGAQSVMITLVWMYTSLLRLLMTFAGMGNSDD